MPKATVRVILTASHYPKLISRKMPVIFKTFCQPCFEYANGLRNAGLSGFPRRNESGAHQPGNFHDRFIHVIQPFYQKFNQIIFNLEAHIEAKAIKKIVVHC